MKLINIVLASLLILGIDVCSAQTLPEKLPAATATLPAPPPQLGSVLLGKDDAQSWQKPSCFLELHHLVQFNKLALA